MAIRFNCARCKTRCFFPDDSRGRVVNCPACGLPVAIPDSVGRTSPPTFGAGSLLDEATRELASGEPTEKRTSPIQRWRRKATTPQALWIVAAGLSLLLAAVLLAALIKSGCRDASPHPPAAGARAARR